MRFTLAFILAVLALMEFPIQFHAFGSKKNDGSKKPFSMSGAAGDLCNKVKSAVTRSKTNPSPSFSRSESQGSQGSQGSQKKSIDSCTCKHQTPYQRFRLRIQRNEKLRRFKRNFSRAGQWLNIERMAKASAIIREQATRVENNLLEYLSRDASEETTFFADVQHERDIKNYLPTPERNLLPEESPDVFKMSPTPEENLQTTDVEAVKRYCIRRCLTIYGYVYDELIPDTVQADNLGKGRVIPVTQGMIYRANNGGGSPNRSPVRLIRTGSFDRYLCECKTRLDFTNLMTGMELTVDEFNQLKKDSSRQALSSLKDTLARTGVDMLTHKEVIGLLYLQMRKHENPFPKNTLPYKIRNSVLEAMGVQDTKDDSEYWWRMTV